MAYNTIANGNLDSWR